MSATLKFGAGKWAAKEGSVLAYNSENNNFKPLPFTFTRASTATRVNESGLIESVASGVPRIDFLDNADGHLLLEPSRTNLVTYSDDFSNAAWTKTSATVTANTVISPNGNQDADTLTDIAEINSHLTQQTFYVASTAVYTASIYLKKNTSRYAGVRVFAPNNGVDVARFSIVIDLETGLITSTLTSGATIANLSYSVVNAGNGWYRAIISGTFPIGNSSIMAWTTQSATPVNDGFATTQYVGDGQSFYIWGAQFELGSYATSYIPTIGSSVTRAAETCNNAGNTQVINSTEGVLYTEISALADDLTFRLISLSDGTTNNRLSLGYRTTSNAIYCEIRNATVTQAFLLGTVDDINNYSKVAVKYKQDDFALWINGIEVSTDNSGLTPLNLSKLNLDSGQKNGSFFYGRIKSVQVYNQALTDSQLAALTS